MSETIPRRVVHKFNIHQEWVSLPKDAKVLTANLQHGSFCIWAEVDPSSTDREQVRFIVVGTGWDFSERANYVSTVFDSDNTVWHVYQIKA